MQSSMHAIDNLAWLSKQFGMLIAAAATAAVVLLPTVLPAAGANAKTAPFQREKKVLIRGAA